MMNGWEMTGWGWAWMSMWMGTGLAVVILLVVLIGRGVGSPTSLVQPREDDAEAVLRRRYAAGEIDEAEFRQRRAELAR